MKEFFCLMKLTFHCANMLVQYHPCSDCSKSLYSFAHELLLSIAQSVANLWFCHCNLFLCIKCGLSSFESSSKNVTFNSLHFTQVMNWVLKVPSPHVCLGSLGWLYGMMNRPTMASHCRVSYLPANAAGKILHDKTVLGARRRSISIIVVTPMERNKCISFMKFWCSLTSQYKILIWMEFINNLHWYLNITEKYIIVLKYIDYVVH